MRGWLVGDYAAQAVVNTILGRTFSKDPVVGEEDAADLRVESGKTLRERIVQLASETLAAPLAEGEKEEWGLGPNQAQTSEQLLDAIDRGNYEGGRTGRECHVLHFAAALDSFGSESDPSLSELFCGTCPHNVFRRIMGRPRLCAMLDTGHSPFNINRRTHPCPLPTRAAGAT